MAIESRQAGTRVADSTMTAARGPTHLPGVRLLQPAKCFRAHGLDPFAASYVLLLSLTLASGAGADWAELEGNWAAALTCPGGEIWFGLHFEDGRAWVINGPERIEVAGADYHDGQLKLEFPHYDSLLEARLEDNRLQGTWAKTRGPGKRPKLNFAAARGATPVSCEGFDNFAGRWKVDFSSEDEPAVAVFKTSEGLCWGTFMTATGDYRYLSATVDGDRLALACFDGAHAFRFTARVEDDRLQGHFWSGDHWHETWTATRDASAALPDALAGAESVAQADFDQLQFRNLKGQLQPLSAANLRGKAIALELFGSWCPNCHDAAAWLGELDEEYADEELSIVGLAFELTGDVDRDVEQVQRYVERFDVKYPVFVAGLADKKVASAQFPLLDRVRAYPTTIFLDNSGRVVAVYHGFSGPATGEEYEELKQTFRKIIDGIIE